LITFIEEDLPLELAPAERSGYRFMGWYESTDFTTANKVEKVTAAKDVKLYAYWEKLYTINFDSNGGTSVPSVQGIAGETIILPSPIRYQYEGTWGDWVKKTENELIGNFGLSY